MEIAMFVVLVLVVAVLGAVTERVIRLSNLVNKQQDELELHQTQIKTLDDTFTDHLANVYGAVKTDK